MPIAHPALLLVLALTAVSALGCGGSDPDVTASPGISAPSSIPTEDELPDGEPDIGGAITSLTAGTSDRAGSLLVEARPAGTNADSYDRASLTVPAHVPIGTCGPGDGRAFGSFADLAVGMDVVAWFDGPVAESYPVQATAAAVAIVCG
jgi:hypothetical protein